MPHHRLLLHLFATLTLLLALPACDGDDDDWPSDDDDSVGDDDDVVDDDDIVDDDDTTPGQLSADPVGLNFGEVTVNSIHYGTLTLQEDGYGDVTITSSVISGGSAEHFSVDDLAGTVVPQGGSVQVEVVYSPDEVATHYAELVVISDAQISTLTVLLEGISQADIENIDNDGDGFTENGGDCDDGDDAIYPGAPERCNGIDDDCDGVVPADESEDNDGDGAVGCDDCDDTDPALNQQDNDFDSWTTCEGDCDDTTSSISPGVLEACNGIDDDCDGAVPSNETTDADGDGYVECEDCDDGDPSIHPGAPETAGDGIDSDCDGSD